MAREQRLAQNESLFREVNERLRQVAELTGTSDGGVEFLCECADEDCVERIAVPVQEYERVRADPRRFLVLPGHVADVERVLADRGAYLVVEKRGAAGAAAERADPRA